MQNTQNESDNNFPAIAQSQIGEGEIQTVNARDLHKFLDSKRQFADWIKERIHQYEFVENQDYVLISQNCGTKKHGGDRRSVDYHISLDMAKELSMVERNEKGKHARKYFIECERKAKEAHSLNNLLNDPAALRQVLVGYTEKVLALESQIEELKPAQTALERISETDGDFCITDAAKTIQSRPKDVFDYMQKNGWIYQRPGTSGYIAYQSKITAGLLTHKVTTVLKANGDERTIYQVRVTTKGLTQLAKLISPAVREVK